MQLYVVGATDLSNPGGLDITKSYSGCRLCGAVFQSKLDREFNTMIEYVDAMLMRKNWSHKHASSHSDKEHLNLAHSGAWCTPEAAQVFAGYGIIALSDMVLSDEHSEALLESKPIPVREVITSVL